MPSTSRRQSRGIRASAREAHIFGMYVSTTPLAIGQCPRQYIIGKDVHSDKEASAFLNPKWLANPSYDDPGMKLLQPPGPLFQGGVKISPQTGQMTTTSEMVGPQMLVV